MFYRTTFFLFSFFISQQANAGFSPEQNLNYLKATLEGSAAAGAGSPKIAAPYAARQEKDALGRTVSPRTKALYDQTLASLGGRQLAPLEKDFILTILNSPELDYGPFKNRVGLIRYFHGAGVRIKEQNSGLTETDLWRLINAVRAAAQAYRIPPAIVMCLTFRESSFDPEASAWTTSAKGIGQLTNPAVEETIKLYHRHPDLKASTLLYAQLLGAKMPDQLEPAPEVDRLNKEIRALKTRKAAAAIIKQKEEEKRRVIASYKDQPGHIFNLETNFGLASAYLAYLRYHRLKEVSGETRGWLTAIAAYNQGLGIANELVRDVFGAQNYNSQSVEAIFTPQHAGYLSIPKARQEEMLGEVLSVYRCSAP